MFRSIGYRLSALLVAVMLATGFNPALADSAGGAPSAQVTGVVGQPAEGKALVVFFRQKAFKGGGVRFKVREGETELGKLSSGTWFAVQTEPGVHEYVVHSEAKDVTRLEVEAGQTYFVAGTVNFGFLVGRPNLTPSDATEFQAKLKKLKPAKPL
jgi:hypothetical protein